MKIKSEHLEFLKSKIDPVIAARPELIEIYETGNFNYSSGVKDLQKRFCFDILFTAGLTQFVCKELYSYLDDTHLYSALKTICPTVIRKY